MSNPPTTLAISGMTCGHCVAAVQKALGAVPGLRRAQVTLGAAQLDVDSAAPADVVRDAIRAIADAGYDATAGESPSASSEPAAASCCAAPRPQSIARR